MKRTGERDTKEKEDQDLKGEFLIITWDKKVCPGRRTLKRTGELINKTRDKKVCPGSQV